MSAGRSLVPVDGKKGSYGLAYCQAQLHHSVEPASVFILLPSQSIEVLQQLKNYMTLCPA